MLTNTEARTQRSGVCPPLSGILPHLSDRFARETSLNHVAGKRARWFRSSVSGPGADAQLSDSGNFERAWSSATRCSTVPSVRGLQTKTGFSWPMRRARSRAWRSALGARVPPVEVQRGLMDHGVRGGESGMSAPGPWRLALGPSDVTPVFAIQPCRTFYRCGAPKYSRPQQPPACRQSP